MWDAVARLLAQPDLIAAEVAEQQARADEQREEIGRGLTVLESALLKCETEAQRWAKAYAAEVISLDELKAYRADIASRRHSLLGEQGALQARRDAIGEAVQHVEALVGYCAHVRQALQTFDATEKRRTFEALNIRVTWRPGQALHLEGSIPLGNIAPMPADRYTA